MNGDAAENPGKKEGVSQNSPQGPRKCVHHALGMVSAIMRRSLLGLITSQLDHKHGCLSRPSFPLGACKIHCLSGTSSWGVKNVGTQIPRDSLESSTPSMRPVSFQGPN